MYMNTIHLVGALILKQILVSAADGISAVATTKFIYKILSMAGAKLYEFQKLGSF